MHCVLQICPPQTIFAEEFTSGNQDVVSEEETPEIFTNEEQEAAGETDEELSVFSSEEVPEFNDAPDEAMAAAENEQAGEIDLATSNKVVNGVYTISSAGDHKFICSQETGNRIVVDGENILAEDKINIYLINVSINTIVDSALRIKGNVKAAVTIYLTGTNSLITKDNRCAGLQKDNKAQLIIKTNNSDATAGILNARSIDGDGAGIGGGYYGSGSCSNIIIDSCSVIASSKYGAGIGGSKQRAGSDITINSSSVTASSTDGAGIGGGGYGAGSGSDITINSSSVTASSTNGDGIGGGYEYGGSCKNITINGGSVKASSVSGSPKNNQGEVYCCTINNPGSLEVKVDGSPWTPVNHTNVEPNNTNLYAWLTEAEHTITVGTEERKYSFNNKQFSRIKTDPTADQFVFTQPNFTYNKDNPVDISKCIKWKDDVTGHGEITQVTYFKEDGISPINSPTDAGTYTFKINVEEGEYYNSATYISAPEWKFIISKAQAPSNKPTITTKTVSWSCKKVGDVKNCFEDDWKWNDSDSSKELPVGVEISATAVYKGADAGNYLNNSVEFKITRSECTHEHTAGRYYSSPSCTSSGYSGDTYCTDCNKTLSYGYTISAYGHDYDNGVITTEPTTETDGIITYTCKRCKHQDTKTFGKQNFIFTEPSNLTYDGTEKKASLQCNIQNIGNIILSYYKNGDNNPQTNGAVDVGTYTVKANIAGKSFIADKSWTFTIKPASKAPGYPSTAKISVPWSCKKVNEIAANLLPANWKWQTEDAAKDLQVGNNSAAAIYTGEDKGNYVSETVTYTIIRSKCEHKHTAERYYSSPSCTSSGYSGDTYCKDCNETISYGYTISAYGHDYDNGVITTEPTAETDGIITYTCKWCKHQDTKTLGKLGDGEPYIEGSFQKKGWDAVNDLIKASKEKDTISIILNGAKILPASVLSEIKGKDISLNLDMENGFIWKINGTSITSETPADTDLSVTNTAEYIPAALYSLISTNQNDFGFHLGRSGAFDFPAVLSVKADASCAGLMANLFWYDVENGVLQCIQTVTVGGAFERSIPYADFTLSKGQDYFIAFGTESLNGRVIHTDGSITDENGAYLRPANTKISSYSIDRNKLTVRLSKGCAGAQGYDFVISKKSDMLKTGKFSKTFSSSGKPQASFRYLSKGTWYVAARSWVLDAQGNKVYGSWTKIKKIKITVVTPQQPKIKNITVEGNTVTVTYTKCKNATGYEILLGNKYKTSAGEKYPVKKYLKRTEGKNTVTVTFTNVKKGTWYVAVRSWNKTSKNKSRVYSPYSTMKKFKTKK